MNKKEDIPWGEVLKELSTIIILPLIVISAFWSSLIDLTKKH